MFRRVVKEQMEQKDFSDFKECMSKLDICQNKSEGSPNPKRITLPHSNSESPPKQKKFPSYDPKINSPQVVIAKKKKFKFPSKISLHIEGKERKQKEKTEFCQSYKQMKLIDKMIVFTINKTKEQLGSTQKINEAKHRYSIGKSMKSLERLKESTLPDKEQFKAIKISEIDMQARKNDKTVKKRANCQRKIVMKNSTLSENSPLIVKTGCKQINMMESQKKLKIINFN